MTDGIGNPGSLEGGAKKEAEDRKALILELVDAVIQAHKTKDVRLPSCWKCPTVLFGSKETMVFNGFNVVST